MRRHEEREVRNLKSRCPCGAVYSIKPEFLGKRTLCKNCGRSFLIEALPLPQPPNGVSESLELRPDGSEFSAALEPIPAPPAEAGPESAESESGPPAADPQPALLEAASLIEADFQPAPPLSEIVLEEIESASGPSPARSSEPAGRADLPDLAARGEAGLKEGVGRRPLVALAMVAVAGALVGSGLMGLVRQSEIDVLEDKLASVGRELQVHKQARRKLEDLKKELSLVQEEIGLLAGADYPAGSIPRTLTAAAVLEYRTAEALLRQQVAALESGAKLTVSARTTVPDPKLAAAVEGEMERLKARLEKLLSGAEGLTGEPLSLVETALATEELNLAILNRNRLIARYGLSAPLPPQGPAGAGPADAGAAP